MKTRRLLYQSKFLALIAHVSLTISIRGQNIANYVSNGGFEVHYTCTSSIISIAKGWRSIDSISGIALYYNACTPTSPVPWDGVSYQYPKSGSGFGGTTFLCQPPQCSSDPNRGYFRNRLKGNLQSGKTYCVKFYVNIRDNTTYSIDGFGAFFSDNSIDTITKCNVPLTYINPQVQNPTGNLIADTMNWTLISGTFVATGVEKHLVIGNFKSDAATNKALINPTYLPTIGCDVYLDDVSCIAIDLPAYAGPDIFAITGNTVYLGRPQDVGIDEACTWYKLPSATPFATAAGITVTATPGTNTYVVRQDICGNIKYDTVLVIQSFTGFNEMKISNGDLKVSPNPASDLLNLSFSVDGLEKEFTKAEILNSIGQLIKETELIFDDKKANISVETLPEGVYLLSVKSDTKVTVSQRFVIIR